MMNRITQSMMNLQLQRNLNANLNQMNNYQNQMATGRRINKPSDDPVGLSYAMRYRSELNATDQFQENVDTANSWLNFSDTMLGQAGDVVQRIRELTVQGANGSNSTSALDAIKKEVLQLTQQLVTIGNSDFNGKHVFNGQMTDVEPYDSKIVENPAATPAVAAAATGNVDVSAANVTGLDNQLTLTLDGQALTVTLPPKDYSVSGGAAVFASDLQDAINTAATSGSGVKVSVTAGNALSIQSTTSGAASTLSVTGSLASMWLSTAHDLSDLGVTAGADAVPRYIFKAKDSRADSGEIPYEIATGVKIPVNISGNTVFGLPTDADNMFTVMQNITNALDSGDPKAVSNQLGLLDSRVNKVLETRADIGAKSNRIDLASERLKDMSTNLQALQSQTEDADIAGLITNLKTSENVYQASLSVGAKIITPSLVDFLK